MIGRVGHAGEKGSVIITLAISLLLIMGVTALALDGGMAYNERRSTQGAADHAALAAAWAACLNEADPEGSGVAAAAKNGYDDTEADVDVQVSEVDDNRYEAIITSTNDTEFAAVMGQDDVTVSSRAVADCTEKVWGGGHALFANGDQPCTNMELDFSGGGITVDGGIHSNGDLRINGNNGNPSQIHGPVTHVGTSTDNGVVFHEGDPEQVGSTLEDPFNVDFDQFLPGNNTTNPDYHYFPGVLDNGALAPFENGAGELAISGIYFAQSEIKNLDVIMASGVTATFVSPGPIKLNPGSTVHYFHPSAVALFSNHQLPPTCDNKAIQWTGAAEFTGLIYAPNGEVTFSMSSGATSYGAIMGYNIDLSGSDYSIEWIDPTGGGPEYILEFEE